MLEEARAALGTGELIELKPGGQKLVYASELEGKSAVVKVVRLPAGSASAIVLERAHREVEILADIDSQYVVRVLSQAIEIGDSPEAICWAEEMLDGEDLSSAKNSYPWDGKEVRALMLDLAHGLNEFHQQGVVHRDLSPGNIRRLTSNQFVLMDPGYARHLNKAALTGFYHPGTPGYLSPEHAPGGRPIEASDVFCVGILAYEALTGQPTFPDIADQDAYLRQLTTGQVDSIQSKLSSVDPDLGAVIDACLQRQPARRYLDASELIAALNEI
ncbi:serine/threonine-protein kinase [Rhodococcus sp. NBC_00294]|uniref:serine/threonine-protein kinase n=1 Tax=Rhodococcus sp. NBC_00294 TaxID=2976004 RepID=UPI002E27AD45|nr:serine/threonine-protein kinase [Rhodococcus sp. NBC_00294]